MYKHVPVMLEEVLDKLKPKDNEKFLDCTFGAGGYSKAILETSSCNVIAVDRDPNVLDFANSMTEKYTKRFKFINAEFSDIFDQLQGIQLDGIVMDLGVSSMQLDDGDRGFSFTKDGPLDMRMNNSGFSAADFIRNVEEKDLANVIYNFGGEELSRRIARKIVTQRAIEPILTTHHLAQLVRAAVGFRKGKIDTATKTFQAIRIFINNELGQLENFLKKIKSILTPGGRIVVVSFHSLEDALVKQFFVSNSPKIVSRSKYSRHQEVIEPDKWLKIINKRPLSPNAAELIKNPRARSAKLRAAIKIQGSYDI
ncbi:MAG: 16S rRNA (cytosine(1402)-N(4))-methyltransferase RsmH [Rickettsiaceae bacterium]|nr:MAG: 16S rRNA (cytosine(1402)-N(4))-methyltransferase RsmH [Rickettsiaceae bacterium]